MKKFFNAKKRFIIALVFTLLLLCVSASSVLCSEGQKSSGVKGWVATDTYRVMNFAVLVIALFFVFKKPVSESLSARIKGIREQLNDLEKEKEKAERELTEYEKKIEKLDNEAKIIAENYIKQGHEAKDRIMKEAEAAIKKLEEVAKKNIEYRFKEAKKDLHKEVLSDSLLRAKDIIKTKINSDDHKRLIDEYLIKVVA